MLSKQLHWGFRDARHCIVDEQSWVLAHDGKELLRILGGGERTRSGEDSAPNRNTDQTSREFPAVEPSGSPSTALLHAILRAV